MKRTDNTLPQLHYISFASSSEGNAGLVRFGSTNILLDAGISARRITQCLGELGLSAASLSAILLTHDHSDHIKGLPVLCRKLSVPILWPGTTFHSKDPFEIGEITVTAFGTPHDAQPSCGFRFEAGAETLGFATDLGYVTKEIYENLRGVERLVIESNYDPDMLRDGPYPPSLKARIASRQGHLSNPDCAELLSHLVADGLRQVALAHLSPHNNTPELAYNAAMAGLGTHACDLCVLDRKEMTHFC